MNFENIDPERPREQTAELLKTDFVYPSGHCYSRDEVERLLKPHTSFMKRVTVGVLRGESSRPQRNPGEHEQDYVRRLGYINEQRVSHTLKNLRLDDDGVLRATVIPTGPHAVLVESAEELSFDMRAFMQVEKKGDITQPVPGTLNIVTFDLKYPGTRTAASRQEGNSNEDLSIGASL